jgi:hypothetical protein
MKAAMLTLPLLLTNGAFSTKSLMSTTVSKEAITKGGGSSRRAQSKVIKPSRWSIVCCCSFSLTKKLKKQGPAVIRT